MRNARELLRLVSKMTGGLGLIFLIFLGGALFVFDDNTKWKTLDSFFTNNFFSQEENSKQSDLVRVARIVDGDTIELENGEKVRYIGINTPESVKTNTPIQCMAKEASARNKELVEGKLIRLEKDVSDRDRYGRLLRYIYLEDGTFVNDILVREGYARALTFPPDVAFAENFKQSEREAREAQRGLWTQDACQETGS